MKKFIVLESYCGSNEDIYTIEANDIYEAYESAEEKGHNLASITVYDLQEARKLALKIIKEVRKNGKNNFAVRRTSREGTLCRK